MSDREPTSFSFDIEKYPTSFRLGEHIVQPHMNRVARGDREIHVQPRVMDLLLYLTARRGEVCSRYEIAENVWGHADVGEEVLSTAIYKLRKALGDDQKNPRHLQTVRKRGYRLAADVPLDPSEDSTSDNSRGKGATEGETRLKQIGFITLPLTLALLVWSMFMGSVRPGGYDTSMSSPHRITPLTSLPGVESEPAISPDGSMVAFVWSEADRGASDIYIKHTDAETLLQLTNDNARNTGPVWSPDGTQVAYVSVTESGSRIMVAPAVGGVPRLLATARGNVERVDWAPDGETIAYAERPYGGQSSRVVLRNLSTGLAAELTSPELPGDDDLNPKYSPDGRLIAFVRRHNGAYDEIRVVPSDRSMLDRSISSLTRVRGYDWSRDGRSIACVGVVDGMDATWCIDLSMSTRTWIPGIPRGARDISLARSSKRMVFSQYRCDTNIKRVLWDAPSGVSVPANSSYADDHPAVSPDGKQVAFVSSRSGAPQVWISDLTGGGSQQLTRFDGCFVAFPRWSPSMDRIVFAASPSGNRNVFVVRAAEGATAKPIFRGGNALPVAWSRNGESVYVAVEESEDWAIWRVHVDSLGGQGEAVRVAAQGAFFGEESLDGRYLYFSKRRGPGLWRARLGDHDDVIEVEKALDSFPRGAEWGGWSLSERGVIGIESVDGTQVLVCHALDGEEVHEMCGVVESRSTGVVSASRDGSVVVYSLREYESGDLMLVDEFF